MYELREHEKNSHYLRLARNEKNQYCPYIDGDNCGTWCPHLNYVEVPLDSDGYQLDEIIVEKSNQIMLTCGGTRLILPLGESK